MQKQLSKIGERHCMDCVASAEAVTNPRCVECMAITLAREDTTPDTYKPYWERKEKRS